MSTPKKSKSYRSGSLQECLIAASRDVLQYDPEPTYRQHLYTRRQEQAAKRQTKPAETTSQGTK